MAQAAAGVAVGYMAGELDKQQAGYENSIHEGNAKYLEQTAQRTIERGNKEEQDFREQVQLMIGNQRVSMAAAGVDIGTGTALAIQEETAYMGAEDARTIKNNAYLEALGYKKQAANERATGAAKMMKAQTNQIMSMATMGMAGYSKS